ncbi:hypothetical protein ES705_44918 [subsurface metagenome]
MSVLPGSGLAGYGVIPVIFIRGSNPGRSGNPDIILVVPIFIRVGGEVDNLNLYFVQPRIY